MLSIHNPVRIGKSRERTGGNTKPAAEYGLDVGSDNSGPNVGVNELQLQSAPPKMSSYPVTSDESNREMFPLGISEISGNLNLVSIHLLLLLLDNLKRGFPLGGAVGIGMCDDGARSCRWGLEVTVQPPDRKRWL